MIDGSVLQRVEEYWAAELGIETDLLKRRSATVVARSESNGAFLFRHRDCFIWQVPEPFFRKAEAIVRASPDVVPLFQEASIAQIFGSTVRRILGPCLIAYCDGHSLRSDQGMPVSRLLTESDRASVDRLAIACGEEAWEHGGVEFGIHKAIFGTFVNAQLVSAASYEEWGGVIAHVGVVTAPAHRGKGYGKSVARATAHHALNAGLVPQWRTLASNVASVGVGRSLGFTTWATHFFVRLAPDG